MYRALSIIIRKPSKVAGLARRYGTPPAPCQPEEPHLSSKGFPPKFTLNDLPSPKGSWKKKHDELQSYYNKVLIGGILFCITGFVGVYVTHDFYLYPPAQPAKRK